MDDPRRPSRARKRTARAALRLKKRRPCAAYTMIEMLLVMVIIGTTASIGMVRFVNAQQNYRLECAARRVKSDLEVCRARAIERAMPIYASFDAASETYVCGTVGEVSAPGTVSKTNVWNGFQVDLKDEPYRAGIARLAQVSAKSGVSFDAFGTPSSGLEVVVAVGSRERKVTVDPNSGQVRVQ